jgi:hypothetical protein
LTEETPRAMANLPLHMYRRLEAVSAAFLESWGIVPARPNHTWDDELDARFIRPFATSGKESVWLKLSSLDPKAIHACGSLFLAVSDQFCDLNPCGAWPLGDRRARGMEAIEGRWRLERALSDIVARGLVQGLEAFCEREFKRPRKLTRWLSPVIEIEGARGNLKAVRICWVPDSPREAQLCTNFRSKRI